MNSQIVGLRVASAVFAFIFLGQLVRVLMRVGVQIGGRVVPLWPSLIAVLVLGFLCVWLWRLSTDAPTHEPGDH